MPSLSAAGFNVTAAVSAAEALKLRESGVSFDAILSDIEMPDMTGLEFARGASLWRLGSSANDRADRAG